MDRIRWKSGKNIANIAYIFDKDYRRQYWLDNEAHIIASILNQYEMRIEHLKDYIDTNLNSRIPTMHHFILEALASRFEQEFNSKLGEITSKHGKTWEYSATVYFEGIKYKSTFTIEEVE